MDKKTKVQMSPTSVARVFADTIDKENIQSEALLWEPEEH